MGSDRERVEAMHIAFATGDRWPHLVAGDANAAAELTRRGHSVEPVIWDDPRCSWSHYDAVIIRSCWDYHRKLETFLAWIKGATDAGARIWNEPSLLSWNSDKRYLLELKAQHVPIVETVVVGEGGVITETIVKSLSSGGERFVIKPIVSASAEGLYILEASQLPHPVSRPVLVQPFLPDIANGELSMIFLDGTFSHAVLKSPRSGDFRTQSEFGAVIRPASPRREESELAERVLHVLPRPPLYARIDVVHTSSGAKLMELELIEPELFLDTDSGAVSRFADAVERRCRAH